MTPVGAGLAGVLALLAALEVDRRRTPTADAVPLTPASFALLRRQLYDDMRTFGGQS